MDCVKRASVVVALAGIIVFSALSGARAEVYRYNAKLGTLPTDQGWVAETKNGSASTTFVGSALAQDSTASASIFDSWKVESVGGFDFTSSTATVIEAGLQVTSSGYTPSATNWRAGYGIAMTDANDYHIILGIGTDGVRLTTNNVDWLVADSSAYVSSVTPTVPTSYKLVAQNSQFELFVDGVSTLTMALGSQHTVGNRANTFRFGDISTLESSSTLLSYVNAATNVPEPGSLLLYAGMLGLGAVCWWRRERT